MEFKVLLLGSPGAGKTAIAQQLNEQTWIGDECAASTNLETVHVSETFDIDGTQVKLTLVQQSPSYTHVSSSILVVDYRTW